MISEHVPKLHLSLTVRPEDLAIALLKSQEARLGYESRSQIEQYVWSHASKDAFQITVEVVAATLDEFPEMPLLGLVGQTGVLREPHGSK